MPKRHKLAIVGCGGMAKAHAQRFGAVAERVEVVAAADIVKERAEAVASLLPGSRAVTDYREVLDEVDAVLNVLPHHLHHRTTMDCIGRGKHVLLEKPMANSEEECLNLMQAAKENGVVLMIAYCMRFHPLVVRMKELIEERAFGECFQVSIWTEQHTERPPDDWMCRKETLGGGQLFSHGCHYIDILLWYLGEPVKGVHVGTNFGTPWMEREGTSNATLAFASGAMGYHFGTWGAKGTRLGYAFHAHCTEGMIEFNGKMNALLVHQGEEEKVLMKADDGAKPTDREMAHFLDCLETGQTPLTNGPESLQGLRVIWRLYEAEEKGVMADLSGLGFKDAVAV